MNTVGIRLATALHPDDHEAGQLAARRATGWPSFSHISVAHCDGRGIAVASRTPGIGVDLERGRSIPSAHLRYFLSPLERHASLPAPVVCWTLKEAAWKALSLGDADHFTSLELVWHGGAAIAARRGGRMLPLRARLLEPWPGYVCAIVSLAGAPA